MGHIIGREALSILMRLEESVGDGGYGCVDGQMVTVAIYNKLFN